MDLGMKTNMPKWLENTSFYRLKFRTIDMVANY